MHLPKRCHRFRLSPCALAFGLALYCACWLGCASPRRGVPGRPTATAPADLMLASTERGQIQPDLSRLPAEVESSLGEPPAYRLLSAADCQCRAVERSAIGELLARERRVQSSAVACRPGCLGDWRLNETLLAAAERDARNRAAATALEVFYKLAEAEGRVDLTDRALAEATAALDRIETVRAEGISAPLDDTNLVRRRLELAAQRIELAGGIERANEALRSLLAVNLAAGERLWPADDWTVTPPRYDVDFEVQRGLEHSAELRMSRALQTSLSPATLETARAALGKIEGLAGLSPSAAPLLDFFRGAIGRSTTADRESSARRRQVAAYAEVREAELAGEIRQRIAAVEQAARLIAMARDERSAWSSRIAELEAQAETGQSTFADIAQARLESLAAEDRVLVRTIAWKQSQVQLKTAQGLLVAECREGDRSGDGILVEK